MNDFECPINGLANTVGPFGLLLDLLRVSDTGGFLLDWPQLWEGGLATSYPLSSGLLRTRDSRTQNYRTIISSAYISYLVLVIVNSNS